MSNFDFLTVPPDGFWSPFPVFQALLNGHHGATASSGSSSREITKRQQQQHSTPASHNCLNHGTATTSSTPPTSSMMIAHQRANNQKKELPSSANSDNNHPVAIYNGKAMQAVPANNGRPTTQHSRVVVRETQIVWYFSRDLECVGGKRGRSDKFTLASCRCQTLPNRNIWS